MDILTLAGLLVGFGGIIGGMLLEGGHISSLINAPAFIIVFLASDLLPSLRMTSDSGPINVMLHCSHSSANLLFSERNPNPGWIASAPEISVALMIFCIFR